MNYRQWKKKYKKEHGVNPPIEIDKRKQVKAAKKLCKIIQGIDLEEMAKRIGEALQIVVETMAIYVERMAKQLSIAVDEIAEKIKTPICEQPDCKNCPFPQCKQEYVDKCKKISTERELRENAKEMQELRENI